MTTDDQLLLTRARSWAADDPDPTTREELLTLIDRRDTRELTERMAGPLAFGTAGLRGVMGAGESRINRAVVLRTTAGLARYLLNHVPTASQQGVVIGYDGRYFSRTFAEDTARVLTAAGIATHLFKELVPTPLTAFTVTHLRAAAGVMVTASHNPGEYNGYKVYWDNGAQIIPPHDTGIAKAIEQIGSARDIATLELEEARSRGLHHDVSDSVISSYMDAVAALSLDSRGRDLMRIVYTPMHGTGNKFARAALMRFGFSQVWSVPEQAEPDPRFPTVAFPNPEEPGALDLAFKLAQEKHANLILANDPDADRLAVAVPTIETSSQKQSGFRQLTGNEVGVLMADFLLKKHASLGPQRLVMTTIVSSPMLGHMARHLGVQYAEVLTGFKWIATKAIQMEKEQGFTFLFGYEEALGYTVSTVARDKDGVGSAAVFSELVAVAAAEGLSIAQELERLARTYGLFVSAQRGLTKKGVSGSTEIDALMEGLRNHLPHRIGEYEVEAVRDVHKGIRTSKGIQTALDLPQSNVLVFDLVGGSRVIARPSGTEPKIKFYFDVREDVAESEPFPQAHARAESQLNQLADAFLKLLP